MLGKIRTDIFFRSVRDLDYWFRSKISPVLKWDMVLRLWAIFLSLLASCDVWRRGYKISIYQNTYVVSLLTVLAHANSIPLGINWPYFSVGSTGRLCIEENLPFVIRLWARCYSVIILCIHCHYLLNAPPQLPTRLCLLRISTIEKLALLPLWTNGNRSKNHELWRTNFNLGTYVGTML